MLLTDGEDLRKTVLNAPIGICILDAATLTVEIVNDKFLQVAGKPYEAIADHYYWDAFAEVRSYYEQALASVVHTGEAYYADEVEMTLIRHGREETIFVTFVYSPVKDETGNVNKVAVWVLENTRQVRERQTIIANEERLRALVTATSDVIYSVSADWRVMQELDGRGFLKDTHEPITGWRDQNVHPDDMEKVNAAIDEAIRTKTVFQLEHRVLRADGSPGWTFSRAVPIFDALGDIIEWFGTASDITARKEIEAALRDAKERSEQQKRIYETITSGTPDLMYVFDLEYRFTYANNALLSMWGKTWDAAIGKGLLENGYEPWHAEMHEREIDQVRATRQPVRGEVSFPHAILGKRVYDYIFTPVFNGQGEVEAVAGVTRDITERKQGEDGLQTLNEEMAASNEELSTANDELLEIQQMLEKETIQKQVAIDRLETSEQQVRSIVAAAPFPIGVYTGREMRIILANQSILDTWGKGNEVIGKTYHEVLPELAGTGIYQHLDDVFLTGKPFHARNQRVDLVVGGALQTFYFNYSFTPLFDADGNVYGVMNTAAELTDLMLAKQQVEQSEENLKAMIAQAPVAMCILLGPDHVVSVANELIIELWGKPPEEVMDRPIFEALPDARHQGLEEVMRNVYETGETYHAKELPVSLIRHGQAEVVYQNFVYQAYRNTTGSIAGVIAITIDVTEQVLARRIIEQSTAELQEIKKRLEAELEISKQLQGQKDDFISMASHELKTPLTSLSALIQVASRELENIEHPFLSGAMEKSKIQVKRMTAMINGFLNVSRLESGKINIELQMFDLTGLINDMVAEASLTAGSHHIHFEPCSPVPVNADRDKIGSVVSNFISNAIKYSPKGRNIVITCSMNGKEAIVSVKDDGMGIKADDLGKIFDRYYRVETAHTRHIAGFGIGLYLSSEIIHRHGGKVWAESESGVGSIFYFSLPLSHAK